MDSQFEAVEYKQEISYDSNGRETLNNPIWLSRLPGHSGEFYREDNYTYIGKVRKKPRRFKVPDTVVVIDSLETLMARNNDARIKNNWITWSPSGSHPMTEEECNELSNNWWNS